MVKQTHTEAAIGAQWFGASDGSQLAAVLGRADVPIGSACNACSRAIVAEDAGIVGTSVKALGGFKPRSMRFVLHATCISGQTPAREIAALRPRASGSANGDIPPAGTRYRDWERDHPGERPPFPAEELDALTRRRDDLQRQYDALDAQPKTGVLEQDMARSDRLHAMWMAISELGSEIRAAQGAYPAIGGRLDAVIDESVTARVRTKAIVLALEDMLPGFSERYARRFDEMIERDYEPLLYLAEHTDWATQDKHAEWARDIGASIYGLFKSEPETTST